MRRGHRELSALVALSVGLAAGGCGKDEAPGLPPADSMDFINFQKGATPGGLTSADQTVATTVNVEQAAAAVGFVAVAVNLYLLVPRLVFAAVVSEKPTQDGDEWIWKHTFPLAGWEAALHGTKADKLDLSMHITGLRADTSYVNDFVWYTGSHAATSGLWQIYDPGTAANPGPSGPVVRIDWARASSTDKGVDFTVVRADSPKLNDKLSFTLKGTIATMAIHDEKGGQNDDQAAADFSVVWSTASGAGKMNRVGGTTSCWDTLANGQADITCPAGDWPLP